MVFTQRIQSMAKKKKRKSLLEIKQSDQRSQFTSNLFLASTNPSKVPKRRCTLRLPWLYQPSCILLFLRIQQTRVLLFLAGITVPVGKRRWFAVIVQDSFPARTIASSIVQSSPTRTPEPACSLLFDQRFTYGSRYRGPLIANECRRVSPWTPPKSRILPEITRYQSRLRYKRLEQTMFNPFGRLWSLCIRSYDTSNSSYLSPETYRYFVFVVNFFFSTNTVKETRIAARYKRWRSFIVHIFAAAEK